MSRRAAGDEGYREGVSPRHFLHFHGKMAHFGGILAVNFKLYSMNETVKISQNPADTSEYDAIKRAKQ